MKIIDRVGRTYGHLAVVARAANIGNRVQWECRCVCGAGVVVASNNLQTGHTRSCGCKGKGSDAERFMAKVDKRPNGCWQWTGAIACGYGAFWLDNVQITAHRAALILRGAALPSGRGMHVDHLCGNKLCVNPDHLELVTAAENIRRRDAGPRSEFQPENV